MNILNVTELYALKMVNFVMCIPPQSLKKNGNEDAISLPSVDRYF